jgi:hypothetical protein
MIGRREAMKNRSGEKIGWIGGWLGGFIWALILAIVFLFQGKRLEGIIGLLLVGLAIFIIFFFAPWWRPDARYWKLMVPVYIAFFAAAAWAVWSYGGFKILGLGWWHFSWTLPFFIPLFTTGRRTWVDIAPANKK